MQPARLLLLYSLLCELEQDLLLDRGQPVSAALLISHASQVVRCVKYGKRFDSRDLSVQPESARELSEDQ